MKRLSMLAGLALICASASADGPTEEEVNMVRQKLAAFAPGASFKLLKAAHDNAVKMNIPVTVGNILSEDSFYQADPDVWKLWASYGVLALEMETSALYTLAARFGVDALTILTVSDNLVTEELVSSEDREKSFTDMMKLALETAISL